MFAELGTLESTNMAANEARTEVVPAEPVQRAEVRPTPRGRLGANAILLAGLVVGLLAGGFGVGFALAGGRNDGPSGVREEVFVEYTADATNETIKWADYTSAPDTFLLVRFQSEPEIVYVTPAITDDPGFPVPQRFAVPRAFLNGEKAYVYLVDDDTASDKFWKDMAQKALKRGGAIAGRIAGMWTLGQVPSDQVIAFCDDAGEKVGELTLDGNDCLASAQFEVRSQPLNFDDAAAKVEAPLTDMTGLPAGNIKVVFGHRIPPAQPR